MSGGKQEPGDPLAALRSYGGGPVRIEFADGEWVIAEDITLLEDEGLVWYRHLTSNKPERYESFDEPHVYSAKLSDILLSQHVRKETPH